MNTDRRHLAPSPVFIMGPTAAGKSRVALALAENLAVEIVSVDSSQVYRGLDIGSAKPNPAMRKRVPHHGIDICDPRTSYSAAQFRRDAQRSIEEIQARGRQPVLVGGTGLYFRALEYGLADLPDADAGVRAELNAELARDGALQMHARLASVDAAAAARIHPNDPQRLVRALEVYRVSGKPLSELWGTQQLEPMPSRPLKIVVAPTRRADLHNRIAERFDDMLERGFVNEVQALRARGDLGPGFPALKSVGYREIWRYLDGEFDYRQMRERAIIATRQLAKRQLTWLRREPACEWFDHAPDTVVEHILRALAERTGFQSAKI